MVILINFPYANGWSLGWSFDSRPEAYSGYAHLAVRTPVGWTFSWLKCETKRTDRRTPEVWQQKPWKVAGPQKGKGCFPTIVFPRGYVSFRQDPVFLNLPSSPSSLLGWRDFRWFKSFFFETGSVSSDRKVGVLRRDEEAHRPRSTKDLPSISGEDSHFSNIFHMNLQWNTIEFDGVLNFKQKI